MSGGSLNYVQNVEAEDFLQGSHLDELEMAVNRMVEYGDLSVEARQATASTMAKINAARDAYRQLVTDVESLVNPLRPVWRQLDYHGSGDVSREQVCLELREYNRKHGKHS